MEVGNLVRYTEAKTAFESDAVSAKRHKLSIDATYTVSRKTFDGTFHNIWLKEFPHVRFNPEMFEVVNN